MDTTDHATPLPAGASRFTSDPRPVVAMDWSHAAIDVTFDGQHVTRLPSLTDLLATPELTSRPHKIVCESTLESWDPQRRQQLVDAARTAGHEIYVLRPTNTARVRTQLDIPKSHKDDARTLYAIAERGLRHLYPLPAVDPAWVARREVTNEECVKIRLVGGKPALSKQAAAALGPYRQLPDEARAVLGNPKTGRYTPTMTALLWFSAQRCATRAEFERLLGMHGSAYPSLLRSELHHHCFRHAAKRGVEWTQFRRELRRAYRVLRQAHLTDASSAG